MPDFVCRFKDSSRFSRIDDVELSALHILDMAASVRFGPRFLILCLTKLLLCSVASSRGMLVPFFALIIYEPVPNETFTVPR